MATVFVVQQFLDTARCCCQRAIMCIQIFIEFNSQELPLVGQLKITVNHRVFSRSFYVREFHKRFNNAEILSRELVKIIYCTYVMSIIFARQN